SQELLTECLRHPFIRRGLPKTTGREEFGEPFVRGLLAKARGLRLSEADIAATVTEFTAASIGNAYQRFVLPKLKPSQLHNQQGPGSLTTRYAGTIGTDLSYTTIVFVGGSQIVGVTNGNWEPGPSGVAGTAPANYGGEVVNFFVNGKAAVRDILLDLTSGSLTVSNGIFPSQDLEFTFPFTATTA